MDPFFLFSLLYKTRTDRDPIVILRIITTWSHLLRQKQQVQLPVVREDLRIGARSGENISSKCDNRDKQRAMNGQEVVSRLANFLLLRPLSMSPGT
jgi:hypothetical protein